MALPGGESGRRFDNLTATGQALTADPLIAASGKVGWIYAEASGRCPGLPTPQVCVGASSAVAILANGSRTFDTGPNERGSMEISAHGRFLILDKYIQPTFLDPFTRGPVRVIDWTR